jgi:CheY-like chemotaxis protein/HPt (histidine-containing phosphotransfer) domain-containing protein
MSSHSEGSAGRGTILIADDNRLVRLGLGEILRRLGYDSRDAPDGRSALDELRRGGYDMLFLDRQMPVLSGIECLREIRRREEEKAADRLPVIVITGDQAEKIRGECLMAGADDVLTKPFTVEKLADILKRWLPGGDSKPGFPPFPKGRKRAPAGKQQPASMNAERIAEIRRLEADGAVDLMGRMAELYRSGSAKLIEEIRAALRDGDAGAMAAAAHELKSSSGSVGGERLCMLCSDMERLGRKGLLGGAEGLLSLVEAEQRVVLGVLSKELSSEKD